MGHDGTFTPDLPFDCKRHCGGCAPIRNRQTPNLPGDMGCKFAAGVLFQSSCFEKNPISRSLPEMAGTAFCLSMKESFRASISLHNIHNTL
jgi:hypothetical protein